MPWCRRGEVVVESSSRRVYRRYQEGHGWEAAALCDSSQLIIQTTWNTLHASMYWNMRLSVAAAAKDAQVQSDILLSDFTHNLVVVGRQPHPDPNFALCVSPGRPRRLAMALPHAA